VCLTEKVGKRWYNFLRGGEKLLTNLLSNQQRILLEHSEVVKKYPFIQKVILERIELTEKNHTKFSKEEQQTITNLPEILRIAELEWDGNSVPEIILDGDERIKCSLCGTDNKLIFYIENRYNHTKLNVGSSCITHFTIMENQGLNIKTIIKEAEKQRKIMMVDKKFPGIRNRLIYWSRELDKFEILIPNRIANRYYTLGQNAEELFNKAIKSKNQDPNLDEFYTIFDKADRELINIADYVKKHKNDSDIIARELADWMKNQGMNYQLSELKRAGCINVYTAGLITEPNFMKDIAAKVCKTTKYFCSVKDALYTIQIRGYDDLPLDVSPKLLLTSFGDYLFKGEQSIKYKELIQKGKLSNDRAIYSFVKRSEEYLRKIGFFVKSSYIEMNTITLGNTSEDIYVDIKLTDYINRLNLMIFGLEPFIEKEVKHFITNRSQFTKEQLENAQYAYAKGIKSKDRYEELGKYRSI
jgi:hypothetical protein